MEVNPSNDRNSLTKPQTPTTPRKFPKVTRPGAASAALAPKVSQTRKLIEEILNKLKKRKKPPSPFHAIADSINNVNAVGNGGDATGIGGYFTGVSNVSLLGVVNNAVGGASSTTTEALEEHGNDSGFHTDDTCDLLSQLRDVLVVCSSKGIFFGDKAYFPSPSNSPYASREQSPTRSRSRSRSPPVGRFGHATSSNDSILDRIMEVLTDIVQNDCRYKVCVPRPSRPPNALQTITLDVAFVLVDQNSYSAGWLYELGMTMLPAFNCFEDRLRGKLLMFYRNALLPQLIACGRLRTQWKDGIDEFSKNHNNGMRENRVRDNGESRGRNLLNENENAGHINIMIEDSGDIETTSSIAIAIHSPSESGGRNNYYDRSNSASPSKQTSITYKRDTDIEDYYIDSMFIPLLYSMVQHIDIKTSSLETIHQMHRALELMIKHKPHLYYDLIEITAHGDKPSRAQAINILFYYWRNSTGHPAIGRPLPNVSYSDDLEAKQEWERQMEQQNQNPLSNPRQPQRNRQPQQPDPRLSFFHSDSHLHQFYSHMFVEPPVDFTRSINSVNKHASITVTKHTSLVERHGQLIPTEHPNGCMQCFKPIQGYGLRCSGCKINAHFGCYSLADGGFLLEYMLESGMHKLSTPRFCDVLENSRQIISGGDQDNREYENNNTSKSINQGDSSTPIKIENHRGHNFHLVNLFTLVLCMACREPLWGVMHQGYRCKLCNQFSHSYCLYGQGVDQCSGSSTEMSEQDALIDYELLVNTFGRYYSPILVAREQLPSFALEEISVMITILEMQYCILKNGIVAGCLLIRQSSSDNPLSPHEDDLMRFELQEAIDLYTEYFTKSEQGEQKQGIVIGMHESTISQEYWQGVLPKIFKVNQQVDGNKTSNNQYQPWILCAEEFLGHLTAFMKSGTGIEFNEDAGSGYLDVNPGRASQAFTAMYDESTSTDLLPTNELVRWVKNNLGFQGVFTSKILLQQMANFGFIERVDGNPILFELGGLDGGRQQNIIATGSSPVDCTFPLPFGIEYSSNVETLISAIVSCLSDIDIAINECGFLLLTRRCWPDPLLSRYTLERLTNVIIDWICSEDEKLIVIAREYTARNIVLPGVRDEMEDTPFSGRVSLVGSSAPSGNHQKRASVYTSVGAGAYVVSRKMLKEKYVIGWLSAIHQMDQELFCDIIYCQLEAVEQQNNYHTEEDVDFSSKEYLLGKHERILRYIINLWLSGVLFSSFNEIITRWLDNVYQLISSKELVEKVFIDIKALQRIFSQKNSGQRSSTTDHLLAQAIENSTIDVSDPMGILTQLFQEGNAKSLSRALNWMELFVRGGVGIPESLFVNFLPLLANTSPTLVQYTSFMQIIWYQGLAGYGYLLRRGELLKLITFINDAAFDVVAKISMNGSETDIVNARSFVQISLALTLHAYACPLDLVSTLGIAAGKPQRSTSLSQQKRISTIPDPTPGSNLTADSPLIKVLLKYSRLERLGLGTDIVRTFWGLGNTAGLIYNKTEFLGSCIPNLLPSIWEGLSPIHDTLSDITMRLLVKLVWIDAKTFRASISKVFEHPDWEVRYDGLDNLYGLFSKLDEKYDLQLAGVFAYLGPIFSYFVGCLWDKEEYVRSKAISYIRTMQQFHLRLAFKCWEAYFETANVRERTLLIKLMIRLNAQFPDWQVIPWSLLLNALNQESDESELVTTADILESYTRPDSILVIGVKQPQDESNLTPGQKVAEQYNLKVLLLTLALQMLGNGIEISRQKLIELKLVVMSSLGFKNCRLEYTNNRPEIIYGEFEYIPDDFSQNMMLTCLGSLKKIMDTPIYLEKSDEEFVDDVRAGPSPSSSTIVIEQDQDLIGGYFIDVVLGMFNSSVDMSFLSHLMLKTWLELMLILVYKHKIEGEKETEENFVGGMRRISELLARDISDENKQLIIELSTCLLKRSMLMVNILGKLIIILGKLMTKSMHDRSNTLVTSATTFLKMAFLKFARNGLFVLIFKNQVVADENQSELDMFRVLRKVIGDETIPAEDEKQGPVYLHEQPIRDVMNQVFRISARKVVSTILINLDKYVQLVYSQPYDEQLITDLGLFFTKLSKHTSEWKRDDWDVNPVLNIAATVLREHPLSAKILIPHIRNLLRHAIQRCSVTTESFVKLLAAYASIARSVPYDKVNVFGEVIIEEVKSTFKGRNIRLSRSTLIVLLQLILSDIDPVSQPLIQEFEQRLAIASTTSVIEANTTLRQPYFANVADNLFDDCANFLENPNGSKQYSKKEFKVGVCVGKLVVAMCCQKYDFLTKIFLWQKVRKRVTQTILGMKDFLNTEVLLSLL